MTGLIGRKEDVPYQLDGYIELLKHGGAGGECHQWELAADDWIVQMEVTFDWFTGSVQRYRFFTILGDQRSIGYTTGLFVAANYAYDHYKQLTGFMTYKVGDNQDIKAAGSFDSFCNHLTNYGG